MKPDQPKETQPVQGYATAWHAMDATQTLTTLNTNTEGGLTNQEAKKRLTEYGPNQLDEAPPTTIWQMLW